MEILRIAMTVRGDMGEKEKIILVVDDEEIIVRLNTRQLEAYGYTVRGMTDATTAMDFLKESGCGCHLVITDLTMPGFSGRDLVASIATLCPGLPVIVFSGMMDDELQGELEDLGVAGIVEKPVETDELLVAVRRVIGE